jgi:cytochrome c-type biogenesis protein CcmH/NrfF
VRVHAHTRELEAVPVTGSRIERRGASVATFALAAALLASAVALGVVAVRGPAPPQTLKDRVRAVASTLRCPVCQDLSVADSPSGLARQLRDTIGSELRAGQTPDQIRGQFVAAYGQWILLSPPRRGLDLVAWIAPALILLGGLGVAVLAARRWSLAERAEPAPETVPGITRAEHELLDRALRDLPDEPE